ncbi:helix-turn-helix transcriptional regulator [Streptomyces albipurpureus]|uniref:AraC family transcriptional regulator n=1 Tax=Streptomyces albipurpureus TaxID=2897419 RepID=A0ABT0UIB5_9ACTN|nr:helix-turn-helix domain-containing protein [Streptomyces sp. CWNU-1]MCM2387962.1 AraC family transcriptional regulator [Streptomyces sp. CWNU-1]
MAESAVLTEAGTTEESRPTSSITSVSTGLPALVGISTSTEASIDSMDSIDDDFIAAGGHPTHVHDFHQFLYVPLGRIVITARGQDYELSPSVALWIPAGIPHSARFDNDSLFVVETFTTERHHLPYTETTIVNVTADQRRMLLGRMRCSESNHDDSSVIAALSNGHPDCLPLPQPTSHTACTVAKELIRMPSDPRTATEWAESLYTNSTSLRRAFRAETGLSFSEWRTRLRLNHSLDLLAQGHLVSTVAARVGFVSTNGYILAFRRYFHETPGAYVRRSTHAAAA